MKALSIEEDEQLSCTPTEELLNLKILLNNDRGAFITGSDFLIDGGATASYFYGELKPEK